MLYDNANITPQREIIKCNVRNIIACLNKRIDGQIRFFECNFMILQRMRAKRFMSNAFSFDRILPLMKFDPCIPLTKRFNHDCEVGRAGTWLSGYILWNNHPGINRRRVITWLTRHLNHSCFRNAREVLKGSRVINRAEVLASSGTGFVECHVRSRRAVNDYE